jgi:hypothetical protein
LPLWAFQKITLQIRVKNVPAPKSTARAHSVEKLRNSLGMKAGLKLGSIGELAKNNLGYAIRLAETIKVFR